MRTEISLVRHGQAQTGAKDEASYDKLSALGRDQARWLGEYLATSAHDIDRIISGPLHRQRQTAEIIGDVMGRPVSSDERLREMDYFGLAASIERSHALPFPVDREGFMTHLPQVMKVWQNGGIESTVESFESFTTRVSDALHDAETSGERVMMVTSGGVIGMSLRLIMSLDMTSFGHMLIQINNASLHRYVCENGQRMLDTFNATPHLDTPERMTAKTYT